jgi:hypothetical protein
MAQTIMSHANPADLARIQMDIQKSLVFADQLNEMTEQMVQVMDSELDGSGSLSQVDTAAVLREIVSAAEGHQAEMDQEIASLLKEIAAAQE